MQRMTYLTAAIVALLVLTACGGQQAEVEPMPLPTPIPTYAFEGNVAGDNNNAANEETEEAPVLAADEHAEAEEEATEPVVDEHAVIEEEASGEADSEDNIAEEAEVEVLAVDESTGEAAVAEEDAAPEESAPEDASQEEADESVNEEMTEEAVTEDDADAEAEADEPVVEDEAAEDGAVDESVEEEADSADEPADEATTEEAVEEADTDDEATADEAPEAAASEEAKGADDSFTGLPAGLAAAMEAADASNGEQLTLQNACIGCHSFDPEAVMAGPTWHNLEETAATRVEGQSTLEYIYTSIVNTNEYIVDGYQPNVMLQTYGDTLSDQDLADIITYLLTGGE